LTVLAAGADWLTGWVVIRGATAEPEELLLEDEDELEEDELELLLEDELLDELEEDELELEEELDEDELELLDDEDELELLLEDELLDELEEDELELEEEDELELLELEDELDELVLPTAGASTITESVQRPPLEAVQLTAPVPAALMSLMEAAPAAPEAVSAQTEVWWLPGVNVVLEAPLHTTSTSHESGLRTLMLLVTALPDALMLVTAAPGARWATPLSETEPALISLIEPWKLTVTVWVPAGGLSR
jgi:hypothetical protein